MRAAPCGSHPLPVDPQRSEVYSWLHQSSEEGFMTRGASVLAGVLAVCASAFAGLSVTSSPAHGLAATALACDPGVLASHVSNVSTRIDFTRVESARVRRASRGYAATVKVMVNGSVSMVLSVTADACPDGMSNPATHTQSFDSGESKPSTARRVDSSRRKARAAAVRAAKTKAIPKLEAAGVRHGLKRVTRIAMNSSAVPTSARMSSASPRPARRRGTEARVEVVPPRQCPALGPWHFLHFEIASAIQVGGHALAQRF